ncbi:MAG TPA: hypothetical protein VKA73_17870 [Rubrobacter sp.]|nr:hypothetical protein [Rubrobacter sp.]
MMVLVAGLVSLMVGLPAYAQLTDVAPRQDRTGFPAWYQDDAEVRVNLCVDNRLCLGGDTRPNRNKPADPTVDANPKKAGLQPNMPEEAFYAAAETDTTLDAGGRIRWRAVLEGAYSSAQPRAGREITFTRIQVTGSNINLPAGTELTFRTPYDFPGTPDGDLRGTVDADGTLKTRVESRLGVKANGFNEPVIETTTGYGPTILRWDAGAPAGFLGNPLRLHTITGGDSRNTFQVFRGGAAASPVVDQFTIAGRCVQNTC